MITVKNLCKEFKVPSGDDNMKSPLRYFFKRKYDIKQTLNNVSFHIAEGEMVGLIGLNGAGKSTTIKLLTGIMHPTSGIVRINGIDPYKNRIENLRHIGCVFGHKTQLWQGMPIIDSFEIMKHMYKIPDKQYKEIMELFCDILDLESLLYTTVDKLSLGQRMKADFACAMLHNPKIIYLDEPTIGLDVIAKERILNFIYEVNKIKKTTVLFTTHNLADIERLCSRAMVMDKGQLIYNGDLNRMKDIFASDHTMQLEIDTMKLPDLQDLPIKKYIVENSVISITYDSRIVRSSVILRHILKQCTVKQIKIYEPKLSEIIYTMYEKLSVQ